MADRRRIITLSAGGRPVTVVDLEVGGTYQAIAETFAYQPGADNPQSSREPGRFGGQQIVGEQNDNGTVTWQALVQGATPDTVAGNIEALLTAVNRDTQNRLLEWRPDGSTYSSYFRLAGPGAWKPNYKWAQWQGAGSMPVDVTFPVRPLVLYDPMTIVDPFDVDSRSDFTFDALTSGDIAFDGANARFTASTSLSSERRARHTVRGYQLLEGQVTTGMRVGTRTTGVKAGATLRASAVDTYVEVYIDDNGTNSRLRIDVVIAGARTNRATVNLAVRMANATQYWVRGRIEGNVVYAEHFSAAGASPVPVPMGAPADSTSYTLTGGEQTSLVAGFYGWSWVPGDSGTTLTDFEARPFTYRNQALPQPLSPTDQIPGSAPALANVSVTPSGGSDNPSWAMLAWVVAASGGNSPLFGVFEESLFGLTGWASSVQAGARGGNDARATASGAAQTFTATLDTFSANVMEADEFQATIDIEVWARVLVSAGNVNPRIRVTAGAYSAGTGLVGPVDTLEFGATGKLITKPSSGTVYRFVRLGTVPVDTAMATPRLVLTGALDVGSSGAFGFDYVVMVPARRRAAGVTGVSSATVTDLVPSTSEWTKTVRSDLSATLLLPSAAFVVGATPGLGGALITPNPGAVKWLVKLSNYVPDDPTSDTTSEQTSHSATVSVDVTPRSYMLRST